MQASHSSPFPASMVLCMSAQDLPYTDFAPQRFFMPGFDEASAEEVYGFLHNALLGSTASHLRIPRCSASPTSAIRGTPSRVCRNPENALRVHSTEVRDLANFL